MNLEDHFHETIRSANHASMSDAERQAFDDCTKAVASLSGFRRVFVLMQVLADAFGIAENDPSRLEATRCPRCLALADEDVIVKAASDTDQP